MGDRDELTGVIDPELEAQYNMRARIPDHPEIFARWAVEAAAHRANTQAAMLDQAYGSHPRQRFDLFRATDTTQRPVVVFIHGGYWQRMDRTFYSHLAAGPNAHGLDMVIAQYRLCPEVRVGDIFDDMRRLVLHLAASGAGQMVLAGHSAGGQLVAHLAAHDWIAEGLPANPFMGALAISGVYDLSPLIQTSLNEALRLDAAEALAASPLHVKSDPKAPLYCVAGALETPAFHQQQAAFAAHLSAKGADVRADVLAGHHHFSIIEDLADPNSAMTRWLVARST
jgi:arylformamidase